jgi:hypothetical protein
MYEGAFDAFKSVKEQGDAHKEAMSGDCAD